MSTVPSPLKSPWAPQRAGLAVVRQHDRQVVYIHPAVEVGIAVVRDPRPVGEAHLAVAAGAV